MWSYIYNNWAQFEGFSSDVIRFRVPFGVDILFYQHLGHVRRENSSLTLKSILKCWHGPIEVWVDDYSLDIRSDFLNLHQIESNFMETNLKLLLFHFISSWYAFEIATCFRTWEQRLKFVGEDNFMSDEIVILNSTNWYDLTKKKLEVTTYKLYMLCREAMINMFGLTLL